MFIGIWLFDVVFNCSFEGFQVVFIGLDSGLGLLMMLVF